jgi:hypothetical protein
MRCVLMHSVTALLLLTISPCSFAAALTEPLDGAMGFAFDSPLPEDVIAAAVRNETPRLPDNIDFETLPEDVKVSGWHYVSPIRLPEMLKRHQPKVLGLLSRHNLPARLVAEVDEQGCEDLFSWLNDSLKRKYAVTGDDAEVPARAPYLRATRYIQGRRQVDVACGPSVLLQYTDLSTLNLWRQEQLDNHALAEQRRREELAVLAKVELYRARAFADEFTLGDQARLQGGLGVMFGQPFEVNEPFEPDTAFAVTLEDLPPPFTDGEYQIELDPASLPIELTGDFRDPDGTHFEALFKALQAKYGQPVKNSARHKIFQVNGNFFVLRALPKNGKTHLSVLDGQARRQQRLRRKQQAADELAALEAQFRKETDGL